ncbi:HTH-type transcriptional regulator MalT [compost metagenome]
MNAIPLIRRKLVPARLPDPHIHRQKLMTLLQLGLEPSRRLTVVCGGPGYGKSTLVAAYLQELEVPAVWYALEESDADLTTFLTYVVGALKQKFPAMGDRPMDLIRSAPNLESVLQTLVGLLAEELAEAAEDGAVLVLDDFQAVCQVPGILKAVDYLVQYLPDNWQLVLTSREQPQLPLPQMRVRQQLVEVGVRELRFTAPELRDLLQRLSGVVLTDAEAFELLGHTDGWVASVILAAQAASGGAGDPKELLLRELDHPAALYDYLAQEVFSRQSPAVQAFLLDTCWLPSVEAASCRDVLGLADAPERIRALIQGNLLLSDGPDAREGQGQGHVYHPTFQRFLQVRLEETRSTAEVADLLRRVGAHVAQTRPEEGLAMLMRAGDWDAAERVVAAMAADLVANNQLERLRAAIERFPAEHQAKSFALGFYLGEVHRLWGGFDQALGLLQRAEEQAPTPGERGRALVHQAAIWLGRGDTRGEAVLAAGEALLATDDLVGRGFAHNLRGAAAIATNQSQAAISAYEAALACYRQLDDPVGQAKVLNNMGLCYARYGQIETAIATYREAVTQSELAGRYPHPMILNNLASMHGYQGRYDEAWQAAGRALELAQLLNSKRDAFYAHLILGAINAGLGDERRAEEHYEACRDGALSVQDKVMAAKAYAGLAELALDAGAPARAKALLRQGVELTGLSFEDPRLGDLAILGGLIDVETGEFDSAASLLDRLAAEFEALGFRYRQAQVAFYQARLASRRGDATAEARWAAACALADAHDFGHLRTREERHRPLQAAGAPASQPTPVGAIPAAAAPERAAVAPAIAIQCFGDLQVQVDGESIPSRQWRGFKTKLILAYLLAHPDGATKEQLTDVLYGETETTRTAILVLLSRLRYALEPNLDKQTPSRFIQFLDGRYSFNFAVPFTLDIQEFVYHQKRGADAALPLAERRGHWRRALAVYQGPFLAELAADCPWLTIEQERYRRLAQDIHTALLKSHLAEGDDHAALEAAEANLAFDACSEFAHQVKMTCLARLGQREGALRHYAIMKQAFERELGSPPSHATQTLYRAISEGREVGVEALR